MKVGGFMFARLAAVGVVGMASVLAVPDTPGTRTVVISIATDDQGEIIPVLFSSGSNGLVPANESPSAPTPESSTDQGWLDTEVNIVPPSTDAEPGAEPDQTDAVSDDGDASDDDDASDNDNVSDNDNASDNDDASDNNDAADDDNASSDEVSNVDILEGFGDNIFDMSDNGDAFDSADDSETTEGETSAASSKLTTTVMLAAALCMGTVGHNYW